MHFVSVGERSGRDFLLESVDGHAVKSRARMRSYSCLLTCTLHPTSERRSASALSIANRGRRKRKHQSSSFSSSSKSTFVPTLDAAAKRSQVARAAWRAAGLSGAVSCLVMRMTLTTATFVPIFFSAHFARSAYSSKRRMEEGGPDARDSIGDYEEGDDLLVASLFFSEDENEIIERSVLKKIIK